MRPVTIGITGGIGAGKSSLVAALARRGAAVFSADDIVHELYRTPDVASAVCGRWGDRVITADGSIDRSKVAAIVFADRAELVWLESLIHPLVSERWRWFVAEQERREPAPPAIVAEVPLLFEAGVEGRYDLVVLVTAPLEQRLQRVGERATGSSHAARRAERQLADTEKAARADEVFVNDGDRDRIEVFADRLLGLRP